MVTALASGNWRLSGGRRHHGGNQQQFGNGRKLRLLQRQLRYRRGNVIWWKYGKPSKPSVEHDRDLRRTHIHHGLARQVQCWSGVSEPRTAHAQCEQFGL
jgi:hypothetical protein